MGKTPIGTPYAWSLTRGIGVLYTVCMEDQTTTKQVQPTNDFNFNPEGKGGFGDHPEHRNPGGRPKVSITSRMAEYVDLTEEELDVLALDPTLTVKDKIAIRQLQLALSSMEKNESQAVDRVLDRLEGKALQRVEIGGSKELEDNRKLLQKLVGIPNATPPVS